MKKRELLLEKSRAKWTRVSHCTQPKSQYWDSKKTHQPVLYSGELKGRGAEVLDNGPWVYILSSTAVLS